MGFQTQVNLTPAPAVAGDFASSNPRASVLAGPGGLVAGALGVTVGKFAWVDDDGLTVQSFGTATKAPSGFVHREQQALIQNYLAEASMNIPVGFPVTLHNEGDFWARLEGANAATIGAAIYADYSDGSVHAVAAPAGASVTGAMGSTNTAALGATFTASADTDATRLVVTSVTGLISIGDEVSGTGITAGTTVLSQVSGTTGGAGTYQLSAANTASAATVTAFGSVMVTSVTTGLISVGETVSGGAGFPVGATVLAQVSGTPGGAGVYTLSAAGSAYTASATGVTTFGDVLNVTAVASGALEVGDPVSGTGIPSGAVVASQVSGTAGGVGVYTLDQSATAYAASTTVTAVGGVLTAFKAQSVAAVGELVKISTWG
jgi:hypothetical protein